MFRTLYSKLAITLVVLFLLLGALFFTVMRATFESQQLAAEQQLNRPLAQRLVHEYLAGAGGLTAEADRTLFDAMMSINPTIELYRLGLDGHVVSCSVPPGRVIREFVDLDPVRRFLDGTARWPLKGDDPRDPRRSKIFSAAPILSNGEPAGYLYIVIGGEEQDSIARKFAMDHTLMSALWLIGGGLVLGLVAGFAAFGLLTTRLQRLAQAMERFRSSNFAEKVPYLAGSDTATADEIDRLGHTYNQMADRIIDQLQELRDNDSARRDLIANVSHDLRTPLASLRGYLDTLLLKGDALSERERAFYLETAARQSERLGNLVAQFFELAKLDAGDIKLTREPFVIEELIQDVVQQFRIRAEGKGVDLSMAAGGRSHFANADIGLTERALGNLIDNAIRHTGSGGSVTVSIRADGSMIEITVADTGSGIPREALPHVFERSFTLDRSRSSASGGSGLGLAITKRIVELHGGRITVDSVVGEGTSFTFQLPAGDRPGATAMAA